MEVRRMWLHFCDWMGTRSKCCLIDLSPYSTWPFQAFLWHSNQGEGTFTLMPSCCSHEPSSSDLPRFTLRLKIISNSSQCLSSLFLKNKDPQVRLKPGQLKMTVTFAAALFRCYIPQGSAAWMALTWLLTFVINQAKVQNSSSIQTSVVSEISADLTLCL